MRMRRTVRNAWVQALRSGEYEQAPGGLAKLDPNTGTPVGFCCLGVLCELALADQLSLSVEGGRGDEYRMYGGRMDFPPAVVAGWAGVEGDAPTWEVGVLDEEDDLHMAEDVAEMNDGGYPFSYIADLIENDLDAADDVRDDLAEVTA